jgi:hypothetical protein
MGLVETFSIFHPWNFSFGGPFFGIEHFTMMSLTVTALENKVNHPNA